MKVLYSTQAVVEFDGIYYYNNSVNSTYKRYLPLGDEITVMSYLKRVTKSKHDRIDADSIKFVFINKENGIKSLIQNYSSNKRKIKSCVDEVDVCVAHVPCNHSVQVIEYARHIGKPCMSVVCGCPFDALWNYNWKGKLVALWAFFKLRRTQSKVEYSIYVTQYFLENRYPNKGRHIGCSNVNIPTGTESVLENRLQRVEKFISSPRRLKICTLGAVDVSYKGQEFVIRSLNQLRLQGVEFEYCIVGGGNNSRLQLLAKNLDVGDLVSFIGPLPHEKVLSLLDEIDIYIQPSKTEGLPRALIEAMSRGCLSLGSKVGGIPELLEEHYLFNSGDVDAISQILAAITKESLKNQGVRNFIKAKEYDYHILNMRRESFIMDFKNSYTKK